MKSLLLFVAFAMTFTCPSASLAQADQKLKVKDGKSIVKDKSKPVRKAIEAWYASNMEAFKAKDVAAVMALRTDDFHTLTPGWKSQHASRHGGTHQGLSGSHRPFYFSR